MFEYPESIFWETIKPTHLSLEPASQDDDDEDVYAGKIWVEFNGNISFLSSYLVHAENARKWCKRRDSWKHCWEKRAGIYSVFSAKMNKMRLKLSKTWYLSNRSDSNS